MEKPFAQVTLTSEPVAPTTLETLKVLLSAVVGQGTAAARGELKWARRFLEVLPAKKGGNQ